MASTNVIILDPSHSKTMVLNQQNTYDQSIRALNDVITKSFINQSMRILQESFFSLLFVLGILFEGFFAIKESN